MVASALPGLERSEPESGIRGLAAVAVVAGGSLGFGLSGSTIGMVRDQLHISCGIGQPGSEGDGSWTCADGIGYLGVAVVLGAMLFGAVVVGSSTALLARSDRVATTALVILAAASTAWIVGWTWYGSSRLVWAVPPGVRSVDYWHAAVGPSAIASGIAFVLATGGLFARGALARAFLMVGAAGLVLATVLQPGLAVNLLAAAGLLAAAAIRAPQSTLLSPDRVGDGDHEAQ